MKVGVLLTVWKRNHLEEQLKSVLNQTLKPDYLIVFQNGNHVNIDNLKKNIISFMLKVISIQNFLGDLHIF